MKRLSQTWRQKHKMSDDMPEKDIFSNITDLVQEGTPRRSQRLAKSKTPKGNSKDTVLQDITKSCSKNASGESKHSRTNTPGSSGQCSLFNSSFGFEFDADALSAVDKMEREHLHVKKRSPLIPGVSPITPICPKRSSSPGMFSVHSNAKVLRSTPKEVAGNENAFLDVEKIGLVGQYTSRSCSPDKAMDTGAFGDNIGHLRHTYSDEPLDTRTHGDNKGHLGQSFSRRDNEGQLGQSCSHDKPIDIRTHGDNKGQLGQSCSHDKPKDTRTHGGKKGQLGQSCSHDKPMDIRTHGDKKGQLGQSCSHDKPKDTRTHGDKKGQLGQSCSHDKPKDTRTHGDDIGQVGQSCSHNNPVDTRTCGDKKGQLGTSRSHDKPTETRTCGDNIGHMGQSGTIKDLEEKLPKSGKDSENLNIPEKHILESSGPVQYGLTNPKISDQNYSAAKTDTRSSQEIPSERCLLSSWDLPDSILKEYEKIGIKTMFEWQAECLCTGNVLNGGNLVYSAPTSAGKTMVAELLMLKRILEIKCKALFILPFVSVAREKMFYLQRMFQEAGIKVDGYMGSQAPTKGFSSIDVAVCTIEKANGLVNRLMEEGQLHTVGAIVVDEMHLLGDPSRGYLLELLLTKVLYMGQTSSGNDCSSKGNVQIIGMSATLPNLDVLAKWLRADLFFTNYRPVPLTETFKVGPVIYDRDGNKIRELSQSRMVSGDDDHVLLLCQETVEDGHAVLMFCPTKSWCEKLAESVARHFYKLGSAKSNGGLVDGKECLAKFDYDGLRDVFEQLKSCQVGLDSVLSKALRYGVAYHHAGLTFDERDIIEGAFRQGLIKVLIATSTLSSGVNLPARRVIIRTPIFHGKLMDGLVYKQMSGRAGRKGVDSQGESILICKPAEKQKASTLLQADLKPVESCLVVKRSDEDEGNGVKRALLEVIASGVASTPADVQRYASCTFYVSSKAQEDGRSTEGIIEATVEYLARNEFITLRKKEDTVVEENSSSERYVPTQLGQATLASSLSPDEALVVFADLRKARKCFVLENELHIIYQVTPIYVQDHWPNLDWLQYLKIWEQLPSHMKRVGELVGIEERFLSRAIRGRVPMRTEAQRRAVGVHKRFYVSLALQELVREAPLEVVARKFGASRGMLQSLQSSAATFAGMVTVFCQKLGWLNLNMLLSQFHSRLIFGVERELVDLVRISAMNGFRARLLYNAGYHTVAAVASASPVEIEKHLRNATPFQSKKRSEWESERDLLRRMRAKCVWVDGRRALSEAEASREIVGEAREILKRDAAKLSMEWKPDSKKSSVNILKGSRAELVLPSTSCSDNAEGTSTSLINGAEVQNVMKTRQTVSRTTTSVGITSNTPQTASNATLQAVPHTTASAGIAPKTVSRTTESTCITIGAVSLATERILSDQCTVSCKSGSTSYVPWTDSSATQSTTGTPRVVPHTTASTTIASRPILPSSDATVSRDIPCRTESTSYTSLTSFNEAQSTTGVPRTIPYTATSTTNASRTIPSTTTTSTAIIPRDVPCTTGSASYASLTGSNATQSTTGTPRTIRYTATSTSIASMTIHTTSSTAIVQPDVPCTSESTFNASQTGSSATPISTRASQAVPHTATSTNIASWTILHTTSSTAIVPRNVPCTTESTSNVPRTASNVNRSTTVAPVAVPSIAIGTVIAPRTIPRITAILPSTIESTTSSPQTASHLSKGYTLSSTTSTVTENAPLRSRMASEFSRSTSDVHRTSPNTALATSDKSRIAHSANAGHEVLPSNGIGLSNGSVTVGDVKLQNTPETQEEDGRPSKRKRSVGSNNTVGGSEPKRNMVDLTETSGSSNVPPRSDYPMLADTQNKTTKNVDRTGTFTPGKCPGRKIEPRNNIPQAGNDTEEAISFHTPSHPTKTPRDKKSVQVILDESPELISISESASNNGDSEAAGHWSPLGDVEGKNPTETFSPELYSEALFPDYESPPNHSSERRGVVSKMSASSGFEMLGTSFEEYASDTNGKNDCVVLDNAKTSESHGSETRLVPQDEMSKGINNTGRNDPLEHEKQDHDIDGAMALCTPGMFDSEVCYSQAIPETATPNRSGSDHSRRSSASFSLRLSQSFEEPSDSDLSTRTLAVVAAMEEKQNEIEAVGDEGRSQGPDGFQVDSDISNETVAAIEAMESYEIGQRTDNCDVSDCRGESGFTRVKDRSLGFISKSVPPLDTAAKSHHSPGASTVSRPQVPRVASRAAIEDPKAKQSTDDDSFNIVDVTENREVFNNFLEEWRTKSFSFSVALEKLPHQASRIGRNFNKEAMASPTTHHEVGLSIEEERVVVVGLAACWKNRDAYFLSLKEPSKHSPAPPFPGPVRTAPATPHVAAGLTLKKRLDSLRVIMGSNRDRQLKIGFATKDQYKVLSRACGVVVNGQLRDPKIATWLLEPGAKERNLSNLVEHFLPQETSLLQGMNGSYGHGSLGLAAQNSGSARIRSCVEAVLTMKLMDHIHPMLEAEGLLHAFTEIEMPVMSCLARMELNGLGFSNDECEHIKHVLQAKLRTLEQEAYRLANRAFSLSSPEEVSRVLFLELKLPPDGNSESSTSPGKPTAVKPTRGGKARKVKYFSTSKDVLQKLLAIHPLPKVILEWRRVNSALTKVVFPVQKEQIHCGPPLNMSRIYSVALTHTATGRVTFVEPNLQNVPRDFDINLPTVISDTPPLHSIHPSAGKKGRKGRPNVGVFIPGDNPVSSSPGPEFSVSMRSAFVPFSGGILLAADYSQLELRLIAHLSGDGKLLGYLNGGGDVFKMIGGEMFHIAQELVSDEQRQRAKQVCYGIIYGIGAKALGLQLSVSENEAMAFVDAFKSRFTGVRKYLKETVDDCRKLGYVTTVSGRKRHLPSIRAANGAAKAHAERQAVNTTVQGSAADLVKLAMANIDRRLCDEFTTCWRTHRQRADGELAGKSTRVGKRARHEGNFRGAYLVLQLHDELLFEVAEEDLRKVVGIVKEEMENAIRLSVNIPVKIKVGKSWGTLEPMEGLG